MLIIKLKRRHAVNPMDNLLSYADLVYYILCTKMLETLFRANDCITYDDNLLEFGRKL